MTYQTTPSPSPLVRALSGNEFVAGRTLMPRSAVLAGGSAAGGKRLMMAP
jgi:hypothetical protein